MNILADTLTFLIPASFLCLVVVLVIQRRLGKREEIVVQFRTNLAVARPEDYETEVQLCPAEEQHQKN